MAVDVLAAAIYSERLRQGLTQAQLAERAGVTRHLVGRIERGHPAAEVGLVLGLVEALGLQITIDAAPTFDTSSDYVNHLLGGGDA